MTQISTDSFPHLFSQLTIGAFDLPHRVIMAPLTRSRAGEGNVPREINAEYYRQRSTAALIVSEATQISAEGVGYPDTPGIHSREQIEGWRIVTDEVHSAGGMIVCQLWHVGRISHPDYQPSGALPVSASAIAPPGTKRTPSGDKPYVAPRALETDEVARVVRDFAQATRNARDAGFDGVEIHGANAYLIDQFLRTGTNKRTDRYGGSLENRSRFALEVTEAVVVAWSADRVGVRLSPQNLPSNGVHDTDPAETFGFLSEQLRPLGLAYVHVVEPLAHDTRFGIESPLERITPIIRRAFGGPLIANGGYDAARAEGAIGSGGADAVAFGRPFIANPDLPARMRSGIELAEADPSTYYGGGAHGYTDFPAIADLPEPNGVQLLANHESALDVLNGFSIPSFRAD